MLFYKKIHSQRRWQDNYSHTELKIKGFLIKLYMRKVSQYSNEVNAHVIITQIMY